MLPLSFYAIAAIALSPILGAMGSLTSGQATLGTLAGIAYLAIRCGMILEDKLTDMENIPARKRSPRRATARRTGKSLVIR